MSFFTTLVADLFTRPLIRDEARKDLDPSGGFYKSISVLRTILNDHQYSESLFRPQLQLQLRKPSFEGLAHKQLEQIKESRSYTHRPKLVYEGPVNLLDPCDSRVSWHSPEWWLIRDTLSDTERYLGKFNGMTFSQYKRKVVIMGAPSVGKTSLTQQFVAPPTYVEGYFPTVEATTHKTITHAGIEYDCELIDSAGQDEYTLFPSKYANGVHGYLLVYSINSRQSFEMIQTIYDKITDFSGAQNMPTVIVGQKVDLTTEQRRVTLAEGQALAKKLNAGFIESSAKDNKNVVKAFEILCGEMQKKWNPAPEKKKSSWFSWGS